MAAPCCDNLTAARVLCDGGGAEWARGKQVGGFGGEAISVKVGVGRGWEEREEQLLGVGGWRQVWRIGQRAEDRARRTVGRGVDKAGG